jgi:hypothetical protein
MTEAEWGTSSSPLEMLRFIEGRQGEFWERKLVLFGSACIRQGQIDEDYLIAVQEVERYANEKASQCVLPGWLGGSNRTEKVIQLFDCEVLEDCWRATAVVDSLILTLQGQKTARAALRHVEDTKAADLLRDVFGPFPFRTVRMNRSWLEWQSGVILAIAKEISDERAFERMPILGDAFEDSGCTNEELVQHCRSGGVHVLGCWALDVALCRGVREQRAQSDKVRRVG